MASTAAPRRPIVLLVDDDADTLEMDEIVTKPCAPDVLGDVLRRVLGGA